MLHAYANPNPNPNPHPHPHPKQLALPPFYVAFVLSPLPVHAAGCLACYKHAAKKTQQTITTSLAALEGPPCTHTPCTHTPCAMCPPCARTTVRLYPPALPDPNPEPKPEPEPEPKPKPKPES